MSDGFGDGLTCDPCYGPASDVNSDSQSSEAAQRIVLNDNYRIDSLSWTGSPYPPVGHYGATSFIVRFYNETVAGLPALSPLATFDIGTNYNSFGTLFSADISGIDLIAGVPYFVTIQESNWINEPGTWRWYGNLGAEWYTGVGGAVYQRLGDSTSGVLNRPWKVTGNSDSEIGSLGLALEGNKVSVPEPSTLGLLSIGLFGMIRSRRRVRIHRAM